MTISRTEGPSSGNWFIGRSRWITNSDGFIDRLLRVTFFEKGRACPDFCGRGVLKVLDKIRIRSEALFKRSKHQAEPTSPLALAGESSRLGGAVKLLMLSHAPYANAQATRHFPRRLE